MTTAKTAELEDRSFGLIAIVRNKRIALPLKLVECDFTVAAGLVEVRMTQVFRQENPKPLDCEYLFPLPANASVFSCEADINGRIIRATVKERGEAVKLAAEKKAEGRRVALVEAERENLFTLSLSNLQPQDLILVTLKYIQPLRHLADMPSVEIPFCPGVRYIPGNPLIRSNRGKGIEDDTDQVPDASRISPVRIDGEHPDAAFIDIHGLVDGRFIAPESIQSPSHDIISRTDGNTVAVRLSDKVSVPDRDFVVRWQEKEPESVLARSWHSERGEHTYALIEIRAPKAAGKPVPMDFYFLVDRSGSMEGEKWAKAALAVQTCVKNLGKEDRAMVTLFDTQFRDFAEQPLSPGQLLQDENFQKLGELGTDGGTEMKPALQHIVELVTSHSPDRRKSLILITDAQVGNEADILKALKPASDLPIHCFGIDIALNDALLLDLARQQKGTFHSLNPNDDVVKIVSDLALAIRHPVLSDLTLPDGWETPDGNIPPLYSGQVYHASARCAGRSELTLTGRDGNVNAMPIPFASQPAANEAPYLQWCKQRIQRCIAETRNLDAVALSVESNLICPLTAFIAWDEVEKVAVANHTVVQPSMELHSPAIHYSVGDCFSLSRSRSPRARMIMADACCSAPPPQNPEAVIEEMVKHLRSAGALPLTEPFTLDERRDAIKKLIQRICNACELSELKKQLERIIRWVFAVEPDAIRRSNLVAELLLNLLPKAEQLRSHRRHLEFLSKGLEAKIAKLEESRRRLRQLLDGRGMSESEIDQMVHADEPVGLNDSGLIEFERASQELMQDVERFVNRWLTSI